ncbi:MAG: hypothetical protein ACM3PY_11170 [Omnitrophica WOR_2 bacterium]
MKQKYWVLMGSVIFMLLAVTLVTSAQGTAVSPIFFLPGDTIIKPAAFEQKQPVIAQGGGLFLAVWTDARTDAGRKSGSYYSGNGSEIYAARLDSSGNLLDSIPLAISQETADQNTPQVAWNGQNWLVVWLSQRPTTSYWTWQVMAARVSPQGSLLDSQPIELTSFANSSSVEFTVGSDGSNWAVFWEGNSAGEADLVGARISATGAVLDPGGRVVLPAEYYLRAHLDVAFAQDEYLLTFQGINILQGIRLRPDLTSIDANYFNISSGSYSMYRSHVESNGTDFFAVWEAWQSSTYFDSIRASRVSHAGQVLDPAEISIWEAYGGFIDRWPQVAWDGSNWFISFMLNGITVLRVSPTGSLLDPNNIPPDFGNSSNKWEPESSSVPGGGIQLVWRDTRAAGNTPDDIYTARVSANRAFGPESPISNGAPSQDRVRAAASGSGYLLAFRSEYSGVTRILAQPVDTSGVALLPEPVLVASGASLGAPSVAWNGSLYLVTWADSATSQIYARRLNSDGTLLDPSPFLVMPGFSPMVSGLGGNFLVVGVNAPSNPQYQFPFAVRVRGTDGAILDAPIQIGGSFSVKPAIAAFNDRWIAVWEGHPTHDDSASAIYANLIFPDGTIGTGFAVQSDFYTIRFHHDPSIATNGTTALVAWSDPRVSNANWNIYGRRVQADGTILDTGAPIAISTAANNQSLPALTWDGTQFVAAFEDQRANTFFMDNSTDIFATRIDASGQVLDPDGLAVFNDLMPEIFPAAAGADGQALLAGSFYRNSAPFLAYRVGLRLLGSSTPPPSPTATPAPLPPATIHSGNLDGSSLFTSNSSWKATVAITVHYSNESLVPGVTVSGTWSGAISGSTSCLTDNTGKCSVSTGALKKRLGSVTLTINNLSKAGTVYDPSTNHDPDGDSNGSAITVLKP